MAATTCAKVSAGEPARVPPAPRVLPDLATLDDQELLGIARSLPSASPRRAAARELLVSRHRRLVWLCVQRYRRGPEPTEDLMQVGYIGLLKAINNFDPAFGRTLATYAQPCITGEIKRHFRDKRWQIHVHRSLKELVLQTREATLQLTQELGRTPPTPTSPGIWASGQAISGPPAGRSWPCSHPRSTRSHRARSAWLTY